MGAVRPHHGPGRLGRAVRGAVAVADTIKPSAAAAVAELRELGLHPILLTGDNEATARAVAAEAGMTLSSVFVVANSLRLQRYKTRGEARRDRGRLAVPEDKA